MLLARAGVPDEDGFITIVSKKPKVAEETEVQSIAKPLKVLDSFYKYSGKADKSKRIRNSMIFIFLMNTSFRDGRVEEKVC